ncbi:hypothetical protein AVEN_5299-1 [Araneus ventricosus]|uniref:Endonuclease/exonuclease/phosphatase domain-containing protein n=1 Tax=Araneus ventricosus TaxID=182803 RepID=A0A4Y2CXB7_ARAVE|nr:hypothetical protein AVEN_5299-1 [Araneus ventricosus]
MTAITINGQSCCILPPAYIHPGVDASHLKIFLFSTIIKYSEISLLINEEFHVDKDVPITVMGDFNVDAKRNEKASGFMKKHFDLNMVPTDYPSTQGIHILIQFLPETLVLNYYIMYITFHIIDRSYTEL